jgi:hypothetical protein
MRAKNSLQRCLFVAVDVFVILFCLAGAAYCQYLFWIDLNGTMTRLTDTPVGIITFKNRVAQRRFWDRVLWERLKNSSPVYNGDLIRTEEMSDATITFTNGAVIDLNETSLIQISTANGEFRVDFSGGNISVNTAGAGKAAPGLIVSSGNNRLDLNSGSVLSVNASSGEPLNMTVLEGNAVLSTAGGATQEIEAGNALSVTGDGRTETKPQVVMRSPLPNARLLNPHTTPLAVTFSWNTVNFTSDESLVLEVAEDRGFTRTIHSFTGAGAATTAANLPEGTFWWRAYARNASPSDGASGKFTVFYAPAPAAMLPEEGAVFRYRKALPEVRFRWAASAAASEYILEAADNPALDNPALATQVEGSSLVYSGLPAGRWYWRVRAIPGANDAGTVNPSETLSFVIEQTSTLEPPVLLFPLTGDLINAGPDRKDTYFSWKNVAEAASYTLRISVKADLSDSVITQRLRENYYVYPAGETVLGGGLYYWGVYQTDAEGNTSGLSPVRSFTITSSASEGEMLFPPDNYVLADSLVQDTRFTWKSYGPVRFQVSDAPKFSNLIVNQEVPEENFQLRSSLPAGTYYWRIGPDMTPKRFTVVPPLAAPVLEEPDNRAGDGPFTLRWHMVSGADYYRVSLYRSADRQRPVYENAHAENVSESITMDSYEGSYYWTVQAFADETQLSSRRGGRVAAGEFTVHKPPVQPSPPPPIPQPAEPIQPAPPPPQAAEPVQPPSPKEGRLSQNLTAPTGLRPGRRLNIDFQYLQKSRSLTLNWNSVEGADAYVFTLFLETTAGRQQVLQSNPLPKPAYKIEDLANISRGTFVWQVEAVTLENDVIKDRGPVAESGFIVTAVLPKR